MRTSTLHPGPVRKPQRQSYSIQTQAPPMGGLDSISPLALMPPSNAVEMDNFIAGDSGLSLREGWYDYATGLGGPVQAIFSYDSAPLNATVSPLATSELFASTEAGIFLIEGGGDLSAEAPDIALSNQPGAGHLNTVQFSAGGGQFLVACSETDGGFVYDGTAWLKMSSTGGPGPGYVTTADPTKFVQVVAWKHRLGFVERGSTVAWFLPIDSVGGDAEQFDFGGVLSNGGALLAMVNWTMDAGAGIDDHLVIIGSAGDVAVYQGTDPTDASAFSLIGTWFVGQLPTGRRSFTTAGGNVYIITTMGLIPISQIVSGGLDTFNIQAAGQMDKLRMLQEELARKYSNYFATPGWELMSVPAKSLFLLSVPSVTSGQDVQYAFNRHTNAWSRLLDIPGRTFAQRLGEVYAGTEDGRVLRILDGYSDQKIFDGTGAVHIRGKVTPAFSYFGSADVVKQAVMLRPVFLTGGGLAYLARMNVDYYIAPDVLAPVEVDPSFARWDSAIWNKDKWSASVTSSFDWVSVEAIGYALAPTIYVSSQSRTVLAAVEFMMKAGGPL